MSLETRVKDKVLSPASSRKKVRIGSRVPEGNREWLKKHGILTDRMPPGPISPLKTFFSRYEKPILIALAFFISILPLVWFQQQKDLLGDMRSEQARTRSLEGANYHMRASFERLSNINVVQQSEINRLALQIREMTRQFNSQIGGFQKGEAMYDALQHTYDNELSRMGYEYDMEVESLRRQLLDKDQTISSLETSLQSIDGVVVRADPITSAGGMANASIAVVNTDFQFVVVDAGELKGAKLGQMVELYHHGALVGYGQIEKLYPDFSGVKVFSEEVIAHLEKGDSVFLHQSSGLQ